MKQKRSKLLQWEVGVGDVELGVARQCTMGSPSLPKKVREILSGGFQIIRGQRSRSANQRREYKRGPIKDVYIVFGVDLIISVLQRNRLRWYGHVLRKEDNDWVKKCMEYEVEGTRRNIHPLTLIVVINHPNLLSPSPPIRARASDSSM